MIEFLSDLGRKMSDTGEFNFYGAYKIPPELIQSIAIYPDGRENNRIEISIQELITSLNQGSLELYKFAKDNVPTVFNSYSFVNFVMSQVADETIRQQLKENHLVTHCKLPLLHSYIKSIAERNQAAR